MYIFIERLGFLISLFYLYINKLKNMGKVKLPIIGLFIIIGLSQCNVPLDSKALYRFSTQDKYVLYGPDTIAVLSSVEYGWEKGHRIKELTFTILDNNTQVDIDALLRYLSRENNGWEIELNFDLD